MQRRHRAAHRRIWLVLAVVLPVWLLLAVALGSGLFLSSAFIGTLALYFATTLSYTLYTKRVALLDVAVLAGLYTLRVVAGATAAFGSGSHCAMCRSRSRYRARLFESAPSVPSHGLPPRSRWPRRWSPWPRR